MMKLHAAAWMVLVASCSVVGCASSPTGGEGEESTTTTESQSGGEASGAAESKLSSGNFFCWHYCMSGSKIGTACSDNTYWGPVAWCTGHTSCMNGSCRPN